MKYLSVVDDTRKSWADCCRVTASFFVILIHACGTTLYKYGQVPISQWAPVNLIDSFVRCAVPLFVMLSGALILKKTTEIITLTQVAKRVIKVILPLLSWNIAYLLYVSYCTNMPAKWLSMFTQPPMYHLWFVYMIIGIYILLPVLQALFQLIVGRRNLQFYLFAIWFAIQCVPIYKPLPVLAIMQQTSFLGYGGYFIIGGIVASLEKNALSTNFWLFIYLVSVAVTCLLTFYLSDKSHALVETAYLYFSPNVFFASVAAFILFSRIKIKGKFALVINCISDRSFLIYLMHVVILDRVGIYMLALVPGCSSYLVIFFTSVITFIICLIFAFCLRLLPGCKEILG